MSKEFDSKMKFRNQTSIKRLTRKDWDSSTTKPSLIALLLVLLPILQILISLKASIIIFCLFSEISETNKFSIYVMTEINPILL